MPSDKLNESVLSKNWSLYENENANKTPVLFMMVGLPGSGKSAFANTIAVRRPREDAEEEAVDLFIPQLLSSDSLRAELYGNENDQEHNEELFRELHKRIKDNLKNKTDVIYDATNISKKRRIAFLEELKRIECHKVCIHILTPYSRCIELNRSRERCIPDEVITRMYKHYCPPSLDEGFDNIVLVYNYDTPESRNEYTLDNFFTGTINADSIEQENSHHQFTIGNHCRAASKYISDKIENNPRLELAALIHDNGKVFTKTRINSKGIEDGECHYYDHHCVGAYDSFFYTDVLEVPREDRIYIANLIYYHMMPFTSWKQSPRKAKKEADRLGDMYNDIMLLHEADLNSH